MIVVLLLTVFFFLAIFMPRSRVVYFALMAFMWILFTFNTGAPDTSTYEWIYNENVPGAFEPIFTVLMEICRKFHLSFVGFRMLESTLLLFFLNLTFRKIGHYKTMALAMYSISPFAWHVSGMRAALSCVILLYAMIEFVENPKKNTIKFCIFLMIATLVHYSSILFIVVLLARKGTGKKNIFIYIFLGFIGMLIVQNSNILLGVVSYFTKREKIITWLSGGPGKQGYPNLIGFSAEIFILLGNILLTILSKSIVYKEDRYGYKARIARGICDINILSLLFIPFLRLNDTYMRLLFIIHGINTVLYALTASCLQGDRDINSRQKLAGITRPKLRLSLYALIVPVWSYVIAIYQNLPYFGTTKSVLVFLNENSLFR